MQRLLFFLGVIAITQGAFGQDSSNNMQDTSMSRTGKMKKDCYVMKDGKMMTMKHGDSSMMMTMDRTMTLSNGATVTPDGTVKMTDGSSKMLKEGWYVDADGKMGMMKKMKKDKM